MVNRKNFDARNLLPRAPESPGPALNPQITPALDQITSEGELRPSTSRHQFTAFPAAPQYQPVYAPDQLTFESEFRPLTSCNQFTAFPAAPQYQPVFAPAPEHGRVDNNNFLFGFDEDIVAQGRVDNKNFPFSFDEDILAQGRVDNNNNFPFSIDEDMLAQERLPLRGSSPELTNQQSDSLNNTQPAIFRSNVNPATSSPPAPTMCSDAMAENTLLDPTAQAQLSVASTSPAPGPATPARLTILGAAELEVLRKHNCILRSNNISIMKLKNEMEKRALAAERKVELLERELREARGGL